MKLTTSRVRFPSVLQVGSVLAVAGISLFLVNCPFIMFAGGSSAQKVRIEFVKDDLTALTKSFRDFQNEYIYHLENYHKARPIIESRFYVSCVPSKYYERTLEPVTAGMKVVGLESWEDDLFDCYEALKDSYLGHIEYFHDIVPLSLKGNYSPPPKKAGLEVRLQTAEANVARLSSSLSKLKSAYEDHKEQFH